jgi:integrase
LWRLYAVEWAERHRSNGPLHGTYLTRRYIQLKFNVAAARRKRLAPGIGLLPDGRYRARVLLDDGRHKSFTSRDYDVVLEKLRSAEAEKRRGRLLMESNTPLLEYLTWWLEEIHAPSVRYTRVESLRYAFKKVRPPLAGVPLRRLRLEHFEEFVAEQLRAGRSPVTIRKDLQGMSQALDYAVKRDLLRANAVHHVTRPTGGSPEKPCLTKAQAQALLTSSAGSPDHALWAFLLSTGARISEALALYWSEVDLEAGVVTILHNLEVRRNPETKPSYLRMAPKTKAGERRVEIDHKVVQALRAWRAMQADMRLKSEDWLNPELMFATKTGRPRDRSGAAKGLRHALSSAGLPQVGCHGLRHTCATLLLLDGVDVTVVSRRLGHKSPSITRDIYQHVIPEQQRDAASVIGAAIWGPG